MIAVTSGKGGVGKTSFAANVAIALQKRRKRVLVLDADLGLANIDVILGLRPQYDLHHVIEGVKRVSEILVRGPAGIEILPAGSGVETMGELDEGAKVRLMDALEEIEGRYDIVLIDTGAGISANVIYFNLAAQATVVVVTPEPTSRTDAYALIKILFLNHAQKRFEILVNEASSEAEGRRVYQNLTDTADRHLGGVSLGYLGCLTLDPRVPDAVRAQRPVLEQFPDCAFSSQIRSIAPRLANLTVAELDGSLGFFWRRLLRAAPAGEM
ncbi:MAG: MinD/ParA family protein [Candidatus Sumerlaeota bacterium]|nr:MinD/ParA family protein [Candidatus Sumerlaeota bacterium]